MKKQSDGRRYNIVFVKAASLYGHGCVNFSYIGRHFFFFFFVLLFCSVFIFQPSLHIIHIRRVLTRSFDFTVWLVSHCFMHRRLSILVKFSRSQSTILCSNTIVKYCSLFTLAKSAAQLPLYNWVVVFIGFPQARVNSKRNELSIHADSCLAIVPLTVSRGTSRKVNRGQTNNTRRV